MQEPQRSDNLLPSESRPAGPPENCAPHVAQTAWIIETHALTKRFHHVTAMDGLTLAVSEGQVFVLLGSNRAGKCTAMKMLVTLLSPTSGTTKVAGHDLLGQPALVRRSVGYVPLVQATGGACDSAAELP